MKTAGPLFLLAMMTCLLTSCQKANDDLDTFRIAAMVGDERLSHDVLLDAIGITREDTPYHYQLYLQTLDDYINFFLIRQEFERHGLEVSKEMLDEALEGEIQKAGSPEALDKLIQSRHWTRQYLEDSLKAEVAANILVTRFPELTRTETATNNLSDNSSADLRTVREIFLKKNAKQSTAVAEQSARNLLQYVKDGISINVAGKISGGELFEYQISLANGELEPSSRAARLGLLAPAELVTKETISKLASSLDGWHIVQVSTMTGKFQKLAEQKVRDKLSLEQGRSILVENLRKNNFVEIMQLPVRPIDKLPEIRH